MLMLEAGSGNREAFLGINICGVITLYVFDDRPL